MVFRRGSSRKNCPGENTRRSVWGIRGAFSGDDVLRLNAGGEFSDVKMSGGNMGVCLGRFSEREIFLHWKKCDLASIILSLHKTTY